MWIEGATAFTASRDVDVVVAVEVGMDAALEADLGRAAFDRFDDAALHLFHLDQVRLPAQVERERALRERAETALVRAHVRVVDVAVADEGDLVADDVAAQLVGHLRDTGHLGAARTEQDHDLVDADFLPRQHSGEHLADAPARARVIGGQQDRRFEIVPTGRPRGVAGQSFEIRRDEHRGADVGVQPFVGALYVFGIHGEPRREHEAGRFRRGP